MDIVNKNSSELGLGGMDDVDTNTLQQHFSNVEYVDFYSRAIASKFT